MTKRADYLIIGQGIAGTSLALKLMARGRTVLLIDENAPGSASRAAAGFIHPVTGRRIVKTWMADTILPYARSFYKEIESTTKKRFLHLLDSLEMVTDQRMTNEWNHRCAELPEYALLDQGPKRSYLQPYSALFRVRQGGWVDLRSLLDHFREEWTAKEMLIHSRVSTTDFRFEAAGVFWKEHCFGKVVFCQGAEARNTDFWNHLPFDPAKGELLTLRIPELPQTEIIVHGIFLIPLGGDLFKAGSTYAWHEFTPDTTADARVKLEDKVRRTLKVDYEVLGQQAGIRPSVKGRRPLLGKHKELPHCYIFNGLGSKGGSLAPWLAGQLARHLEEVIPLPAESDISRFE